MKKVLLCVGAGLMCAACTTAQQQSVAQAAAKFQVDVANACLVAQPTLASLELLVSANPAFPDVVNDAGIVCKANSAINTATLTSLINTSIPAAEQGVEALPTWSANTKQTVVGVLTAFQIALSTALVVYNQSQPAAVPTAASS